MGNKNSAGRPKGSQTSPANLPKELVVKMKAMASLKSQPLGEWFRAEFGAEVNRKFSRIADEK